MDRSLALSGGCFFCRNITTTTTKAPEQKSGNEIPEDRFRIRRLRSFSLFSASCCIFEKLKLTNFAKIMKKIKNFQSREWKSNGFFPYHERKCWGGGTLIQVTLPFRPWQRILTCVESKWDLFRSSKPFSGKSDERTFEKKIKNCVWGG